jgi:hypothetical protein
MVKELKKTDKWLVLDNNYSPKASAWLAANERTYGYTLLHTPHGKNIGLHNGFNLCMSYVETSHILGVDPDMFICSRHFDEALLAHAKDVRNVVVQAFNTYSLTEMRNPTFEKGPAGWLIIPDHPVIMGLILWQTEWLRQVGGLQEPTEYYGHLEATMWKYLNQVDKRWVFALNSLEGWKDLYESYEDEWFRQFKIRHAHHNDKRHIDDFRREFNDIQFMVDREQSCAKP